MIDARAYFDDSGTHRQSLVTVIGGYVATQDVWAAIEKPWRAALNDFHDKGVHCFHATDCLAQTGQFARLQCWERKHVYKQMASILEGSGAQAVWGAIMNEDFKSVAAQCPKLRDLCPTAYDFCVDRIVSDVVSWSDKNAGGSRVSVVMAMQKEHKAETDRTLASWLRVKYVQDRIGAVAHDYPDRFVPLQAADMLAHEAYRAVNVVHAIENRQSEPERIYPRVLGQITGKSPIKSGGLFDREYLEGFAAEIRESSN